MLIYEDQANESRKAYIQRMRDEGNKVVFPERNELLIDIDSEEQYETFRKQLEIFQRNVPECAALEMKEAASRSGYPRRHITIYLPFDVDPWQRIAWQAALGSDPARELLSAIRLRRGGIHPTIFVERA